MTAPWRQRVAEHWADQLYRQSYYMLASTGVSAGTGLLFWVLAAHRTQPDGLGVAAGLVAAVAFLSYLTSFALPYTMLHHGGRPGPVSSMVNASLLFSAATSLLASLVFAVLAPIASPHLASQLRRPLDILLFGMAGVGAGASVLLDNLLAARRHGAAVLTRNAAAGLGKILLLAVAPGNDPRWLYLAATMPALVSSAAVLIRLPQLVPGYRHGTLRREPQVYRAATFALGNYPAALLSGAPQFALPLLAITVLSPRQNAFFYVAWSLAQILCLLPSVISNVTLSQGTTTSDPDAAPTTTVVRRGLRFSLTLLAPACVVGLLLATPILRLYGGDYLRGAVNPLRLVVLAALPWTFLINTKTSLRIEHRLRRLTLLSTFFCAVSLSLPLALAPRLGVSGMAAGWLGAVTLAAALGRWLESTPATAPTMLAHQHSSPRGPHA